MTMRHFENRDVAYAIFCGILISAIGLVLSIAWPTAAAVCTVGVGVAVLALLILCEGRRISNRIAVATVQLEALSSVTGTLRLEAPLPDMHAWAITPDVAKLLIELIVDRRPEVVVECGAGASTIVNARMLQLLGRGRLYTLESFDGSLDRVRATLKRHGLEEAVSLVSAPLREQTFGKWTGMWYDVKGIEDVRDIDLVFVDGPRQHGMPKGVLARYGALPALLPRMRKGGLIVMDDGARAAEQTTIQRWVAEYGVQAEYLDGFAKGVWLVTV